MFTNDIVGAQKGVTLSATHPALPETAILRLRSENGSTDRANSLLGNFTIAHSTTKELGGGYRHVARLNYRQQGDVPPASVYIVTVHPDSVDGEQRARECFIALLAALVQLDGQYKVLDGDVEAGGLIGGLTAIDGETPVTWDTAIAGLYNNVLPRLFGRES